jgi:ABC-type branched-subunit amino acid transport system substrate-binding protein
VVYGGPDVDPASLTGVYSLGAFFDGAVLPEPGAKLVAEYHRRWHRPAGRDAVVTLDGIRLLLEGFREAKDARREGLGKALAGIKEFVGVTDRITWSEGQPRRTLFLARDEAGKRTPVRTVPGAEP